MGRVFQGGTVFFLLTLTAFAAKRAEEPRPEKLLMSAMKKMSTGTWEVKGTATFKKTIKLHGLLAGKDFDLTMDPGVKPGVPMRGIVIGNKAWVCSDGETWHAGSPEDRDLYNLTHTPISSRGVEPPFEEVGSEQHGGATWLHIQLKVPEGNVDPKALPQYWLVLDSQGQALYIGHAEMPVVAPGGRNAVQVSFDYAPAREKITRPPRAETKSDTLGPPVDDKIHGFNEIEAHKFDWAGKVVRVETNPKVLQSEQIGGDTYRVMLKDTATPLPAYGFVEFPGDALVKLGFLKKTASGAHNWAELERWVLLRQHRRRATRPGARWSGPRGLRLLYHRCGSRAADLGSRDHCQCCLITTSEGREELHHFWARCFCRFWRSRKPILPNGRA